MDNCKAGCPCNGFDCNLSLNVTDPVIGLEHLGIFETTGPTYNGECMDSRGLFGDDIYVHDKAYYYSNAIDNDHIRDCSDFCKNVKIRNG